VVSAVLAVDVGTFTPLILNRYAINAFAVVKNADTAVAGS
jgi:hypothetical protein